MNGSGRVAFVFGALASVAGVAAQERVAADVALLDDDTQAAAACDRLLAAGALAVPLLRQLLAGVPERDGERTGERAASNALYLLGRLADVAATALPEVKECLARGSLPVRNQAVWALGQIGARTRDQAVCRECWGGSTCRRRRTSTVSCTPRRSRGCGSAAASRCRTIGIGVPPATWLAWRRP